MLLIIRYECENKQYGRPKFVNIIYLSGDYYITHMSFKMWRDVAQYIYTSLRLTFYQIWIRSNVNFRRFFMIDHIFDLLFRTVKYILIILLN